MDRHVIRPGRTLLPVYLGGLLVLAVYSFFSLPNLKTGRADWIWGNTLSLFVQGFIPLHTAALLFGYSLYFKGGELFQESERRETFLKMMKAAAVLFIVLTVFYMALLEGLLPVGLKLRDEALRRNGEATELLSRGRQALEEKRYFEAAAFLDRYDAIIPDDPEVRQDRDAARSELRRKTREEQVETVPADPRDSFPREMSFQDFLARGEELFSREDYVGAEHYAAMAYTIDRNHPGAKRLLAESRDRIARTRLSSRERENIAFFRQKRIGYDMLARGDYIGAFYHLQDLLEDRPDDPDLRRYLEEAYQGTRKISFFLDEVPWETLPDGDKDILFLNRRDDTGTEFLSIRRILPSYGQDRRYLKTELEQTRSERGEKDSVWRRLGRFMGSIRSPAGPGEPRGYFALDIEGIKISSQGEKVYHFTAPYGKFVEDSLVMHCLDRGRRNGPYLPRYLIGEAPDPSPWLIRVSATPLELDILSAGITRAHSLNSWQLFAVSRTFSRFGWDPNPILQLFLDRLLLPFAFMTLSFAATAYGLRLRSRYLGGPPAGTFFFLPVLPVLTGLIFEGYRYICSPFPAAVLRNYGFSAALGAFLLLQTLLLFLSLILMARGVRK